MANLLSRKELTSKRAPGAALAKVDSTKEAVTLVQEGRSRSTGAGLAGEDNNDVAAGTKAKSVDCSCPAPPEEEEEATFSTSLMGAVRIVADTGKTALTAEERAPHAVGSSRAGLNPVFFSDAAAAAASVAAAAAAAAALALA
jgi:hypothetical protein